MSNSQNPNNKEYWRSRGFQDRPTNWKDQARRINQSGQATAAANAAAASLNSGYPSWRRQQTSKLSSILLYEKTNEKTHEQINEKITKKDEKN